MPLDTPHPHLGRDVSTPQSPMATTFALDVAERSLLQDGFFALHDPLVGERIMEMEQRDFQYFTEYGLDFCKQFAFDEVRRRVVHLGVAT